MVCMCVFFTLTVCLRDAFSEVIHDGRVDDQDLLRSELWTTLFRGGYMIGKLQRSLSGKFVSVQIKIFCHSSMTICVLYISLQSLFLRVYTHDTDPNAVK